VKAEGDARHEQDHSSAAGRQPGELHRPTWIRAGNTRCRRATRWFQLVDEVGGEPVLLGRRIRWIGRDETLVRRECTRAVAEETICLREVEQ